VVSLVIEVSKVVGWGVEIDVTWLFESLEVPAVLAAAELDAPAVPEAGRVSWM
jgi:hypothetical protein